jgi:ketosteroid isomerase-like protein
MKKTTLLILGILFVFTTQFCFAQQSDEAVIRNFENAEREAILKGDTAVLIKLFSPKVVVNNPENTIVTFEQLITRIRTGKIDYSSLERTIEKITMVENIAIVMGKEIVTPKGATTNAGKTVTRRFTNIWMKTEAGWKLTARQATIISVI